MNHTSGNKGDRAMLVALLRDMARLGYRRFTVSMDRPDRWSVATLRSLGVSRVVPWGWQPQACRLASRVQRVRFAHTQLPRLIRAMELGLSLQDVCSNADPLFLDALRDADLIVGHGGHHLTTLLSPRLVTAQAHDLALAALGHAPLLLWSQTIGPIAPVAVRFARAILSRASIIAVRDQASLETTASLGVHSAKVMKTVDSAFSLCGLTGPSLAPSLRSPVVGCAVYVGKKRSLADLDRYTSVLATAVDALAEYGYRVRFIPMSHGGGDVPTIDSVIAKSTHGTVCSVADPALDVEDHLAEFARVRWVLAHKTHSVVLSLAIGTPVLALAYHPKTRYFMEQFGLGPYCIEAWPYPMESELHDRILWMLRSDLDSLSCGIRSTAEHLALRVRSDLAQCLESALHPTDIH